MLPAVALPSSIRVLTRGNGSSINNKVGRTRQHAGIHPPSPLSIHVYLSEAPMAFLPDLTEWGCPSKEHYF